MKVVINKTGEIKEVRQRKADRLINRGTAHLAKEQKIKKETIEAELIFDGIEKVTAKPKVKVIKKPKSRKKKSKFKGWKID